MSDDTNNSILRDILASGTLLSAPYAINKGMSLARSVAPYVVKGAGAGLRFGRGLGITSLPGLLGGGVDPSSPQVANALAGGINRPPGGIFGTGAGHGVAPTPTAPPVGGAAPTANMLPVAGQLSPMQRIMQGFGSLAGPPPQTVAAAPAGPTPPPNTQLGPVNTAPPNIPQWGQGDILAAMNGPPPQQPLFGPHTNTQGPSLISKFMQSLLGNPVDHDQQSSGYQA